MKRRKRSVGRTIWSACYPPILYFIISFVVEMVMVVAMMLSYMVEQNISGGQFTQDVMNDLMGQVYENSMFFTLVSAIVSCFVFFPLMYLDKRRREREGYEPPETTATVAKIFWIIPLAAVSCMGFNRLVGLLPASVSEAYEETAEMIYTAPKSIIVLSVVIFAPLVEELIFRGLVYRRFREIMNFFPAAIISAAIFGIFHMNIVQFIYATCLGLIMAFVYERYQSIWASVLMHVTANGVSVLLTFLPLSGDLSGEITESELIQYMIAYLVIMVIELALTALFIKVIDKQVRVETEQKNQWRNEPQGSTF